MVRGLGRLPFIGRRASGNDASPSDGVSVARRPIDPELAPLGPPVLLPRLIFRQVLFDATELVPAWAMPRGDSMVTSQELAGTPTKRQRRPRAAGTSTAKPKSTTPRRGRKANAS